MPIKDESLEQGTNRKHPVPQNVMDVEFKVVGDLTVRQVVYVAVGGTLTYILWRSGLPVVWQWGLAGGMALLTIAVAFIPYEDRGLDKWLIIFIQSMFSPTQMIWKKSYSSPAYFLSDYAQIIKNEIITLTPVKNRNKLEEYLELLEDRDDPLEAERNTKISLINEKIAASQSSPLGQGRPSVKFAMPKEKEIPTLVTESINPSIIKEEKKDNKDSVVITPVEISKDELESKIEILDTYRKPDIEVVESTESPERSIDRPISVTPKMEASLAENKGFKVPAKFRKLPTIIVEEDIKDIKEKEESLEKKVNELVEIAKRARSKYQIETGSQIPQKNEKIEQAKSRFGELEKEKEKLLVALDKSTEQVKNMENTTKKKEQLEDQVKKLNDRNKYLEKILLDLKEELYDLKQQKDEEERNAMKLEDIIKINKTHNQQIAQDSNVISGTVKDSNGNLVEDAVILVKDEAGNVARALKTNAIGQFASQSPVENGKYRVEVVKGGLVFDIMLVEAKGIPISPLYFVSRK